MLGLTIIKTDAADPYLISYTLSGQNLACKKQCHLLHCGLMFMHRFYGHGGPSSETCAHTTGDGESCLSLEAVLQSLYRVQGSWPMLSQRCWDCRCMSRERTIGPGVQRWQRCCRFLWLSCLWPPLMRACSPLLRHASSLICQVSASHTRQHMMMTKITICPEPPSSSAEKIFKCAVLLMRIDVRFYLLGRQSEDAGMLSPAVILHNHSCKGFLSKASPTMQINMLCPADAQAGVCTGDAAQCGLARHGAAPSCGSECC